MKIFPVIATIGVVAFWLTMNALLVRRQFEAHDFTRYQKGIASFLGTDLRRERWMEICRKKDKTLKKKGYTGLTLEKVYCEEGIEYHASVETFYRGEFPLQGLLSKFGANSNSLKVWGTLVFDRDLKPLRLQLDINLTLFEGTRLSSIRGFSIEGVREDDNLRVMVLQGDQVLLHLPIPLESLALSDGLTPAIPVAGFEVGETFKLRVFDPLGLSGNTATVRVLGEETREVHGALVDVYELETELHGTKTRSLVTEGGEVVRQELGPPLGLILLHAKSRKIAQRGFEQ